MHDTRSINFKLIIIVIECCTQGLAYHPLALLKGMKGNRTD